MTILEFLQTFLGLGLTEYHIGKCQLKVLPHLESLCYYKGFAI